MPNFELPADEGADRRLPLEEAIKRFVEPGQTLYFAVTHSRPHAALYEVCRQFRGRSPGFTMVMLGIGHACLLPIHLRLVKRVIATFLGDTYPTPSPSPIVNAAWQQGLEIEPWTVRTFVERLRAGAEGVTWASTRSLAGSSMLDEHVREGRARVLDDGQVLVRALRADVAFVHAACADRAGNVVLTPPYGDGVAGIAGARRGAIVTVERVVPTSAIRRMAHAVRIPRHAVLAVCEVALGAHPSGLWAPGVEGVAPYAEDYAFLEEVRREARRDFDGWFERTIAGGRDAYMDAVGRQRIMDLRQQAVAEAWRARAKAPEEGRPTGAERTICAAASFVRARCAVAGHRTLLAGIGASNLAAWLAARRLADGGREVDLMAEIGLLGYSPRPGEPFIFHFANLPTCRSLSEIDEIMGMYLPRGMGVLGAAQVDVGGNVNTTMIPGERYLIGSGGHNDVASAAAEIAVLCGAEPGRLVERVPYVTSPGDRVTAVITELGLFQRVDGRLKLRSAPAPAIASIGKLRARCGFALDTFSEVEEWSDPDPEDLALLRVWDPRGHFRKGTE